MNKNFQGTWKIFSTTKIEIKSHFKKTSNIFLFAGITLSSFGHQQFACISLHNAPNFKNSIHLNIKPCRPYVNG